MTLPRRSALRGYALVLTAACLWATIGPFYRALIELHGLSRPAVVAYRTGIAAIMLLIGLRIWRPSSLRIRRADIPFFLCFGIFGVAGFFLVYMQALTTGTVAQAAILLYTAPIWILIWSAVYDGERVTPRQLIALALALLGCALVAQAYDPSRLRLNAAAVIYGLLAGMGYASYSLWSAAGTRRGYDAWTIVLYALGIGAVVLFAITPPAETVAAVRDRGAWPLLVGVALVTSVLAQVCYTFGLHHIRTSTASILATVEPFVAAMLAWALLDETLVWPQVAGGACVLLAVGLLIRQRLHATPEIRRSADLEPGSGTILEAGKR